MHGMLSNVGAVLAQLVATEIFRALLAPFLHIAWTAILGATIFAASRRGAFRITPAVLGTYLLVATLHGLWDGGIPDIARAVVQKNSEGGAVLSVLAITLGGWALVLVIGHFTLRAAMRRARREEMTGTHT
jgi:hypothetical protein